MKKLKIKASMIIIAVLLMFTAAAFSPVQAQEISREDVYFHSTDWGPPEGWNPLLGARSWAWGIMYPTLYMYSVGYMVPHAQLRAPAKGFQPSGGPQSEEWK